MDGGLEHCAITITPAGLVIEGVVAGDRNGRYGAHYRVLADPAGATREVQVDYLGGPSLHVAADGSGGWRDLLTGAVLEGLAGCIDVDIGVTPSTNALPIRRLRLAPGQSAEIAAAYVPLPSQIDGPFLPRPAPQRYTRLGPALFRYEGLFRAFTAELPIDEDGFVLDYPTLFRRLP